MMTIREKSRVIGEVLGLYRSLEGFNVRGLTGHREHEHEKASLKYIFL
jgi:hypothetical protein